MTGKSSAKFPKLVCFGYGAAFGSKAQLKPLPDFVFGTGRSSEAFIEEKFLRDKATELRLMANFGFQSSSPIAFLLPLLRASVMWGRYGRSSGVNPHGIVAALTFCWSASNSGVSGDSRKENSRAIKEAQLVQLNWDRRRMQFAQARDDAFILRLAGVAKKLQGDVPRLGRRPSQAILLRPMPHGDILELFDH